MQAVFSGLLTELGSSRWSTPGDTERAQPRPGQRYLRRSDSGIRRGYVLEIRPPIGVALHESMAMGGCRLEQRIRCVLSPREEATAVVLGVRYQPTGLAQLRTESWHRWLLREHSATLVRLAERLGSVQDAGVMGQSHGSSSMTVAKITKVRGKPILR